MTLRTQIGGRLGSSKRSYAREGAAARTLRQNSLRRNTMVTARVAVVRMLEAPRSGSAHGTLGARGARPLQVPTSTGVAGVSVGGAATRGGADWTIRDAGRERPHPYRTRARGAVCRAAPYSHGSD